MVQLVHVEDVAEAIALALAPGRRGIYNIVGPGEVPLSAILDGARPRAAMRSHIRWQSRSCRSRSRSGISSFPVAELDFIRYVCMVDGRRAAAELGFRPRFGLRETIHAVDDPRLSVATCHGCRIAWPHRV